MPGTNIEMVFKFEYFNWKTRIIHVASTNFYCHIFVIIFVIKHLCLQIRGLFSSWASAWVVTC